MTTPAEPNLTVYGALWRPDCRRRRPRREHKQVAAAVGEGASALINIRAHMEAESSNRGYAGD